MAAASTENSTGNLPNEAPSFRVAEDILAGEDKGKVYVSSRWFFWTRVAVLWGGFSTSVGLVSLGTLLLGYLLIATSLAPARDRFSQDLYFDYSQVDAVASASFHTKPLPASSMSKEAAAYVRALVPNSRIDVWLEMELADDELTNGDIFQVTAKLISGDGREAAAVSRPCILAHRSRAVRQVRNLVTLPLALMGLWKERQTVRLKLFNGYADRMDVPFVFLKAILKPRAGTTAAPRVYRAAAYVHLRLGWLGRLLFIGRPGAWTTYLLCALGLSALGLGCTLFIGMLLLWLLPGASDGRPSRPAKESAGDDISEGTVESDVDSVILDEPDSNTEEDDCRQDTSGPAEHGHMPLERVPNKKWV